MQPQDPTKDFLSAGYIHPSAWPVQGGSKQVSERVQRVCGSCQEVFLPQPGADRTYFARHAYDGLQQLLHLIEPGLYIVGILYGDQSWN